MCRCRFYSEGVLDTPECSSEADAIDHAVLLVGYGEEDGTLLGCLIVLGLFSGKSHNGVEFTLRREASQSAASFCSRACGAD